MTMLPNKIGMNELLESEVGEGASDLHLTVGLPPMLRINGSLQPLDCGPLMPEDTERLMKSITSESYQQKIRASVSVSSSRKVTSEWRSVKFQASWSPWTRSGSRRRSRTYYIARAA